MMTSSFRKPVLLPNFQINPLDFHGKFFDPFIQLKYIKESTVANMVRGLPIF